MLEHIAGVRVGHAQDEERCTGCTVVRFDERTLAACVPLGGVTASMFTDGISAAKCHPAVDALFVVGGSVAGLGVAEPICRFLVKKGVGIPWGDDPENPATTVPIVAGGVVADRGLFHGPFPYELGGRACARAWEGGDGDLRGNFGAGTGATVGKLLFTPDRQPLFSKGGVGCATRDLPGGVVVAAMSVVNAIGSIYDRHGRIVAGQRAADGRRFLELEEVLEILCADEVAPHPSSEAGHPSSTTVTILGTNAKLQHQDLIRVATMAQAGLARAVRPCFTSLDGDSVFAFTTGSHDLPGRRRPTGRYAPLPGWTDHYGTDLLGIVAADVVQDSIVDAVEQAEDLADSSMGATIPCVRSLRSEAGWSG
jgi:L-aminopeptidase/D-esterase-like protein